jgi:23S rRNA-/tRNA-specific pseudouridylate synthase
VQLDRNQHYLSLPHRLDRAVSGIVLVALTKKAAKLLSAQFSTRKTRKQYQAIVQGVLPIQDHCGHPWEQRWEDYIRKVDGKALAERCEASDLGAKLATTVARTVQSDLQADQSRVELIPITGRMHQLRLQTALRGHPIVGDPLYNPSNSVLPDSESAISSENQIRLHAHRLGFHDPATGRWLELEASCPF